MFDNDTEEAFYWAGFIAADGCIYNNRNYKTLQINLSLKDKEHLAKLAVLLNSNLRTFVSNDHGKIYHKCSVQKQNSKLIKSLERFNITNNKSLTYIFPEFVKKHQLCNHFIRGYIDGDGCWRLCKKDNQYELNICGTEQFLMELKSVFNNKACKRNVKPLFHNGQYRLIYCGNISCSKIRDFVYRDANVFLERKYKIAKDIKRKKKIKPTKDYCIYLYTKLRSTKKVGNVLGYSQQGISNIMRDYSLEYLYGQK